MEADTQISGAVYQIYDAQGKEVSSGRITNRDAKVGVNTLPEGMYLIKIESEKEILAVPFIKGN